jgi:hypothetical protein
MAKFAKKNPSKKLVAFESDFFFTATMQKFTQNEPLTMTLPNSQVPNSTFGTTKNPIMTFSFHKVFNQQSKSYWI